MKFSSSNEPSAFSHGQKQARLYVVSPCYFETMKIPLQSGRLFTDYDNSQSVPVAVVNRTLARDSYSSTQAIGRFVYVQTSEEASPLRCQIVGVVADTHDWPGQPRFEPQVYLAFQQRPAASMWMMISTTRDPAGLAPAVRQAVREQDKSLPVTTLMTMRSMMDQFNSGDSLMCSLMSGFAGLALLLAGIGVYGVIAYAVAQRTHEFGVRMALGAQRNQILREVLKRGAVLAAAGVAAGLLISLPLPRLFSSLFVGFSPDTWVVFVAVPLLSVVVAFTASYIPARRATKVDPMVALRYE